MLKRTLAVSGLVLLGMCVVVGLEPRPVPELPVVHLKRRVLHRGDEIGILQVPRLGLSILVVEGADDRSLDLGAGHIPGTALPGRSGNVGIAAHRDTCFRPLRNIRASDRITLTTPSGMYSYVVDGTEIVGPADVRVLRPARQPTLTLVTCYPFYYRGSAPKRFIVHACERS